MLVVVKIEIEVVDAVVELVAAVAVDAIVIVVDMPFDVLESEDLVVVDAVVAIVAVAVVAVVVDEIGLQPAVVAVLEQLGVEAG